jgi:hypothetical protein
MTTLDTLIVRLEADAEPLRRVLAGIQDDFSGLAEAMSFGFPEAEKSLEQLRKRWDLVGDGAKDASATTENAKRRINEATKTLENAFTTAFGDAILEGKKLSEVLRQLEMDLLRLVIRRSIAEPLADAVSGLFGSLLGGLFGGGRQHGGRVSPHKAFLVGEKGPELFVPPDFGEIISNRQMAPSAPVAIHQTINVNVAPDVSAVARAEIVRQLPMIRNYAAQGIADAKLRGRMPA